MKIGFAMCGSFCTFAPVFTELERLTKKFDDVVPILSEVSASVDSRFGTAKEHREKIAALCGRKPLLTIEGAVPNPTERIEGCTFWPRCPHASEICKRAEAPQKQLTGERSVKCWLYAEEADRETAEKKEA